MADVDGGRNTIRVYLKNDIDDAIVDLWDDHGYTYEEAKQEIIEWVKYYLRDEEKK